MISCVVFSIKIIGKPKMCFLINVLTLISFPYVLGGTSKGPTRIYENLKCEPVFAKPNDSTPSSYNCPLIQTKSNNGKCYFHGKFYSEGESIDDEEVFGSCRVGCSCRRLYSGEMGFACAVLDCPRIAIDNKSGCRMKYELDKCCNTDVVCPPFSTTCEVNQKTYNEGELFDDPDDKCTQCVCQKGFKGKYEAPFCKKRDCLDEIGYQTKIRNFCAPSYITKDDCCPFSWICPKDDDKIISKNSSNEENLKCIFGEKTVNIGDSFERKAGKGNLVCECQIPPFMTCIQNYQYPRTSEDY